jgi:hypothetical protein
MCGAPPGAQICVGSAGPVYNTSVPPCARSWYQHLPRGGGAAPLGAWLLVRRTHFPGRRSSSGAHHGETAGGPMSPGTAATGGCGVMPPYEIRRCRHMRMPNEQRDRAQGRHFFTRDSCFCVQRPPGRHRSTVSHAYAMYARPGVAFRNSRTARWTYPKGHRGLQRGGVQLRLVTLARAK